MNAIVEPAFVSAAQSNLSVTAGSKLTRVSKKDYFATLPKEMKRGERERAYAKYAEEFSAVRAAEITGAVAAGLIRLKGVKTADSGKSGCIAFEVVSETESEAEKLRKENEALKAKLAVLESKSAA